MTQLIKVLYVGQKPEKRDNVNHSVGARGRVWRGFGASLDVQSDEASVLFNYPDVWCSAEDFEVHDEAYSAKLEAEEAEKALIAEREAATRIEQERLAALASSLPVSGKSQAQDNDSEDVDRETLLRAAILQLDPSNDKDYTKTKPQKPRVDRIVEITSASFSASEITTAFQELVASGQIKLPE